MMYAMCVCIGQDHKDSSTKSDRDPSRREAGEGVHRRDGNFQSIVTVRVPSEALASLKKFVLSVGTPKKLRQDNAKGFLAEQFKTYCLDAGILQ